MPQVDLIQVSRLPAHHTKLVRAQVVNLSDHNPTLFELCTEIPAKERLVIEDGIVEQDANGLLVLPIQNYRTELVLLEKGQTLSNRHTTRLWLKLRL